MKELEDIIIQYESVFYNINSFLFQNTESGGSIFIFSGLTLLLYTLIFFKSIRHAIRNDNKL